MADTKISALPASTTPLAGTEVLPIVQSGVTKQVSVANLTTGRPISATQLTLSTGNLVMGTSGRGIDFSATPGTGTSELFNDYEEGTWTPTDASGAGLTFADAAGFYTKIGRVVNWQAFVQYPTTASASGAQIGGVPFTILDGAGSQGRSGGYISTTNATGLVQVYYVPGTSIRFYNVGFAQSTNAELSAKTIYFAGFYVV